MSEKCYLATIRKISVSSGYLKEDFFTLATKGEHPVAAVARLMQKNTPPHFTYTMMWFSEIPEEVFVANQAILNKDVEFYTRTA